MTIDKIKVTQLKKIEMENGNIYKGIDITENDCSQFGELYFSFINENAIKAWKKHDLMVMNLIVPVGKVKFVFFCEKTNLFREEIIGRNNYKRLTVPPNIWFGFMGLDKQTNLVVNFASIPHDEKEVKRIELKDNKILYNWRSF